MSKTLAIRTPSGSRLSSPGLVRPIGDIPIDEIAKRVARRVTPDLRSVQGLIAFSSLAAGAVGGMGVETATLIKDFGGAANSAAEVAHRASELTGMRLSGERRALAAAATHARVAGQLGFDLVRARVAVAQAEEVVQHFKSSAAQSALTFMRPELGRLQAAFESERSVQGKYLEIMRSLRSKSSSLGVLAHAAESTASKTMMGRSLLATGKLLIHPWVGKSLIVLGVGIAAIKGGSEAPTASNAWKAGYGTAGGIAAGVSDIGLGQAARGNPLALFYDPAVKYGAKAMGYGEAGDKLTIGTFFDNCSTNIFALTQGLTTGDTAPMSAVHKRNMEGAGSTVLQGYAMMGDMMSRSALVDAAMTRVADWSNNVPSDFRSSPSWWSALKSDGGSIVDAGRGAWLTLKGD